MSMRGEGKARVLPIVPAAEAARITVACNAISYGSGCAEPLVTAGDEKARAVTSAASSVI
jgi:hypothetical protein